MNGTTDQAQIRVYTAILNQTGTDAPVPIILHNTTGRTITWTRNGTGNYSATLVGEDLIPETTAIFIMNPAGALNLVSEVNGTNISVWQSDNSSVPTDGIAFAMYEFRIYNI